MCKLLITETQTITTEQFQNYIREKIIQNKWKIQNLYIKIYIKRALSDEFVIVTEDKSEEYFLEIISGVSRRFAIPNERSDSVSINKSSVFNGTFVLDCDKNLSSSEIKSSWKYSWAVLSVIEGKREWALKVGIDLKFF